MLSVPGAKTVRGYSFFGDSFVYVLFEDGTDPYWARSRVLEYLNQVQSRLPPQAQDRARAGCDRRGLGLRIRAGRPQRASMDLSQLRALQDWFLKYELKTVPNVAEVASVGGMVRQYQVVLDPDELRAYGITHARGDRRDRRAPTRKPAARCWSWARPNTWCARRGYLQSLDDFRKIPLTTSDGAACRCGSATSRASRSGRRCAAASPSSNGEGEVAGGIDRDALAARTRSRRSTR